MIIQTVDYRAAIETYLLRTQHAVRVPVSIKNKMLINHNKTSKDMVVTEEHGTFLCNYIYAVDDQDRDIWYTEIEQVYEAVS